MHKLIIILVVCLIASCSRDESSSYLISCNDDIPQGYKSIEFRRSNGSFAKELLFNDQKDTLESNDSTQLIHQIQHSVKSSGYLAAFSKSETTYRRFFDFKKSELGSHLSIDSRFVLLNNRSEEIWSYEYHQKYDPPIESKDVWFGSLRFSTRKDMLIFTAMTGEGNTDGFVKLIDDHGTEILSVSQINGRPITFPTGVQIGWDGKFCLIQSTTDRNNGSYPTDVLFVDLETSEIKAWPEQVGSAHIYNQGSVNIYHLESDSITCLNLYDIWAL